MSGIRSVPILTLIALLIGCSSNTIEPQARATPSLADELTIYYYADYIPQTILDAFSKEYGIKINYQTYVSPDQAASDILNGADYDVVWISSAQVPLLVEADVLAAIDYRNIPRVVDLNANFRDLAYDPGNRHSVPYYWGTTGLVVRTDLFDNPISDWNDLWQIENAQIAIWQEMRFVIGFALQSLGYSVNTDKPEELEAALNRLIELKNSLVFLESTDTDTSAYALADGRIPIALGWSYDALLGQSLNPAIAYITPQEGTMLWFENIVIPKESSRKHTAEVFINFMLRPEIAAQYANEYFYAVTSDAAREAINPDILNNPAIYPDDETLAQAEFILPLSPEVQALYDNIWQRLLDAMGDA
jgi:spermidine/putrescine transport system substrate-binding protein